jgi:hypothetical protein
MQQEFENDLKHYFKEIKSLFPAYGKREKQFLADLTSDVNEYIASNPEDGYAGLISAFGEPKTIVSQYIAGVDSEYLAKQIRTARIVKICVAIIAAAVIIAMALIVLFNYLDSLKAQESYIGREIIQIEEE